MGSFKKYRTKANNRRQRPYVLIYDKKDHCEECGFIAVHAVQLDIDHIDGNKANMELSNFRTLCANCHRLKTHLKQEHLMPEYRPGATKE